MFVGEAPGAEEDRQGLPFVGRAGQLLNQLLEEIGLSREQVFIANVLKSRPPGNRDPQPLEIEACKPYLFEQVRLIEPKVVCTLGNFATKLLSGSPVGITKVRGTPQVHELGGRTVFLLPLLHPAAALRTPAMKETLRDDLATVPGLLSGTGARSGAERRGDRRRRTRGRRRAHDLAAARRRPARHVRLTWSGSRATPRRRPKAVGRPRRRAPAPGDVVVVSGEVGAGKTTLIRGACRALGIEEPVTSPTFTIGQRYGGGRLPVSHLDLYRLREPRGRGPGPARRLPRPRRRRLRRVAGGGGRAARPAGAGDPARSTPAATAAALEIEW